MSENDPRDYRTLGDLLRDAREERKLDHEQVNEATKISARVLAALEKDDLDGASGPVYARGFVRTLAKFYDLDPEWLDAKLDQLAGETSRPVAPVQDDDGIIAGPVGDAEVAEAQVETGPKWEVESTRVRKVGSSSNAKVPKKLIYGMVGVLVVAIVLVVWMSRSSDRNNDQGSQRSPAAVGELASNDEDPGPARPAGSDEIDGAGWPGSEGPQNSISQGDMPASEEVAGGIADTVAVEEVPTEIVVDDVPDSPIDLATQEEARPDPEPLPTRADPEPERLPTRTDPEPEREPEPKPDPDPDPEPETPTSAPQEMVESREDESPSEGVLPSILRPAEDSPAIPVKLRVIADAAVEVTLSADGARSEVRFLQPGEEWAIEGRDHFLLAVSDPSAIRLEMDGRPRTVPEGWNGTERMLFPQRGDG